ncbi:hypothetical protein Tco_0056501, partial [Tanacetum coccineum]
NFMARSDSSGPFGLEWPAWSGMIRLGLSGMESTKMNLDQHSKLKQVDARVNLTQGVLEAVDDILL